jgi:hypothetical protein
MHRISIGLALLVAAIPSLAQGPAIEHAPVGCVVADKFPLFEARVSPAESVGRARVYFRGSGNAYYTVEMKPESGTFRAVLPKPKKDLGQVHYYIEVVNQAFAESRTAEYVAEVAGDAASCSKKGAMAAVAGSASLIVTAASGAPAIPAGFSAAGITSAGAAAGAGAAGAASTGGGIGATALVVGGLAIAGGAVAVGAAKGGGEEPTDPGSGPNGGGPTGAVYSVGFVPTLPGLDVSACAGRPLNWGSQALSVPNTTGGFDDVWSPNEPNTLRIAGQLSATSFQAAISCVNGARSGTISATGANGNYNGTFEFGNSRGQVTVTRQ